MDEKSLEKLEFGKIVAKVVERCATSLGRALARRLAPRSDAQWIREQLEQTAQARALLGESGAPPFSGIEDVHELLARARRGGTLEPGEFLAVAKTLRALRLLEQFFRRHASPFPQIAALARSVRGFPALEEEIARVVSEDGQIADNASPELLRLRRRMRKIQESIERTLSAFLNNPQVQRYLQDRLVTVRNDRPCVPIKAEFKGAVRGIVHDASASGATVFLEPEEVIEQGNELQAARAAEQHELRRILRALSAELGRAAEEVAQSLDAAARLDFVFARAKYSLDCDAAEPQIAERGCLRLLRARHPLIPPEEVVPIDVWVGEEFDVLLITGPNTGGKTVSLKTVGLLSAMAHAGLHIPADERSEIPVFRDIFADIGDEQSIEQSLSTFSAHMSNITRILERTGPRCLVLLDELGAGTDPSEGAALGIAILRYLKARGALVLATTHLNDLKIFAEAEERVCNASVEFDPETLAPTYHLRIGLPGSSNAFAIAERLGVPREVLEHGRAMLSTETKRLEEAVAEMERARRALERERQALEDACAEHTAEAERARREAQLLREERERAQREGFAEARRIVSEAREEARRILEELRRQPREGKATQRAVDRLKALEQRVAEEEARATTPPPAELPDIRPGDAVLLRSIGKRGVALSAPDEDGRVEVSVGAVKMEVPTAELELVDQPVAEETRDMVGQLRLEKTFAAKREIDLRGLTVDEATLLLDKFLDDASLAELDRVYIIHGKGTGALREGVREFLKNHRLVKSFRFAEQHEGGTGVTIAEL